MTNLVEDVKPSMELVEETKPKGMSVGGSSIVLNIDQSVDAGTAGDYFGYTGRVYMGQSFTTTKAGKCAKLSAELKIGAGTPAGNIECFLYSDNSGVPGSLLSTFSVIDSAVLGASYVWYDFTIALGNAYDLVAGTVYHLVLKKSADSSNYPHWNVGINTYAGGNLSYSNNGTSWTTAATSDLDFKQYYYV